MDRKTSVEVLEWVGQPANPPVSPPSRARAVYNATMNCIELSINGSMYACIPLGGFAAPVDSISQASASRLVDLDATNMPDGTLVFVRTVRDSFRLRRPSVLAVDGITIVNAIGGGQWLREYIVDDSWRYQAEWYVSEATGNDENDGLTSVTPIQTHKELERRWGSNRSKRLEQDTTVFVIGGNITRAAVIAIAPRAGFTLRYIGTPFLQRSGTLTGATAPDPATNTPQTVTDATIVNWAAHVGQRILLGNGAVTGIGRALSATEALTGYFIIPDADGKNGSVYTPVGNETYEVHTVPRFIQGINITCQSEGDIVFDTMGTPTITMGILRDAYFVACAFDTMTLQGGNRTTWVSCIWSFGTTLPRACEFRTVGGLQQGAFQATGSVLWKLLPATAGVAHFIMVGSTMNWIWPSRIDGGDERGIGVFNSSLGAQTGPGAVVYSLGVMFGANNTSFPMSVVRSSTYMYAEDANKPTIAGVGSQFLIGGNGTYTWASDAPALLAWGGVVKQNGPFGTNPGERKQIGGGTLVDGVCIIGAGGGGERIFLTATSRIILQPRGNNGGVATGKPTVVATTVGAPGVAAFTVNALDLTTALVATDDRDFDWMIVD